MNQHQLFFSAVAFAAAILSSPAVWADFSSEIISMTDGSRMEVPYGALQQAVPIGANWDTYYNNQNFIFRDANRFQRSGDSEFFRIQPAEGERFNLCLEVNQGSLADGTQLIQWACYMPGTQMGAQDHQLFRVLPSLRVPGAYQIMAVHSGDCLTLGNDVNQYGQVSIVQRACAGTLSPNMNRQLWSINIPGRDYWGGVGSVAPPQFMPGPRPVRPRPRPGMPGGQYPAPGVVPGAPIPGPVIVPGGGGPQPPRPRPPGQPPRPLGESGRVLLYEAFQ